MKILVDSHTYIWAKLDDPRLSKRALSLMRSDEHELFFSLASLWEISLKIRLDRLRTLTSSIAFLHDSLAEDGITLLPIRYEDILAVEHLEPRAAASHRALSRQAKGAARKRTSAERSASAKKAAATRKREASSRRSR